MKKTTFKTTRNEKDCNVMAIGADITVKEIHFNRQSREIEVWYNDIPKPIPVAEKKAEEPLVASDKPVAQKSKRRKK